MDSLLFCSFMITQESVFFKLGYSIEMLAKCWNNCVWTQDFFCGMIVMLGGFRRWRPPLFSWNIQRFSYNTNFRFRSHTARNTSCAEGIWRCFRCFSSHVRSSPMHFRQSAERAQSSQTKHQNVHCTIPLAYILPLSERNIHTGTKIPQLTRPRKTSIIEKKDATQNFQDTSRNVEAKK